MASLRKDRDQRWKSVLMTSVEESLPCSSTSSLESAHPGISWLSPQPVAASGYPSTCSTLHLSHANVLPLFASMTGQSCFFRISFMVVGELGPTSSHLRFLHCFSKVLSQTWPYPPLIHQAGWSSLAWRGLFEGCLCRWDHWPGGWACGERPVKLIMGIRNKEKVMKGGYYGVLYGYQITCLDFSNQVGVMSQ